MKQPIARKGANGQRGRDAPFDEVDAQIDAWLANGAPNSGSAFKGTYASTVGARLPRGAADPAQVSALTAASEAANAAQTQI